MKIEINLTKQQIEHLTDTDIDRRHHAWRAFERIFSKLLCRLKDIYEEEQKVREKDQEETRTRT